MKKTIIAGLAFLVCLPHASWAQEANYDDQADREQLLKIIEEQTAIATKTKMNADYVPGMVTVLHGGDLEGRGARTVWEALALVPGIELSIEPTGRRRVVARGLGNIWASGNVKILLNGVAQNSAELGLADPVFNIAVGQVDRIEVVRGPGSAIYGEFAYLGVINVVTRSEGRKAFAFGGSFDTKGAGALLSWQSEDKSSHLSLNVAGWHTSGDDSKTGPDDLYNWGLGAVSHAPGKANEDLEQGTAILRFDRRDFSLIAQWAQDALGDHFGINEFLPPDHNQLVERNRHRSVELRQAMPLPDRLQAQVVLGWQDVQREEDGLFITPAERFGATGPDVNLNSLYRERKFYGGLDLTWKAGERQNWLLGVESADIEVDAAREAMNLTCTPDYVTCTPTAEPVDMEIGVPLGTRRTLHSVVVQDEFRVNDSLTLTAGARHDDYSDIGSRTSPRVAGVWRLEGHHILKAQYSEAFRPPTLYEQSVVPSTVGLRAAEVRTGEFGYIYEGGRSVSRLTLYHSRFIHLVDWVDGWPGNKDAYAWGGEWEQELRLTPKLTLDANLSYSATEDRNTNEPIPGSSPWIANAGLLYDLRENIRWALQSHFVSGYHREPVDPRSDLDGYATADLTASFLRVGSPGMVLRVGVKNLFDADVRFPSRVSDGTLGYPDDYPQPGRTAWIQLSYER